MKVQVKRDFKSYFFCHQKSNKKADRFCMKIGSTSNIAHGLEPKKNEYFAPAGRQNII